MKCEASFRSQLPSQSDQKPSHEYRDHQPGISSLSGRRNRHSYSGVDQRFCRAGIFHDVFTYSMERSFRTTDHGARIYFLHFPLRGRKHQYDVGVHEVECVNGILVKHVERALGRGRAPYVVHAHDWLCFGSADDVRRFFGVPVVLTMHMVWGAVVESRRAPSTVRRCHKN